MSRSNCLARALFSLDDLSQTKKTGTLTATRKGGLGKDSQGKKVKRAGVGKMRPGRSSSEGDTKIKGKTFTYEK